MFTRTLKSADRARRADFFLRSHLLRDGSQPAAALIAEAATKKLTPSDLKHARRRLGVISRRERDLHTGRTMRWRWALPSRGTGPVSYPTWRFGPGGQQRRVENADEDASLGPGWFDAPPKDG